MALYHFYFGEGLLARLFTQTVERRLPKKCESMGNGFFFPGDVHGGYLGMHVCSRRSVCVCVCVCVRTRVCACKRIKAAVLGEKLEKKRSKNVELLVTHMCVYIHTVI